MIPVSPLPTNDHSQSSLPGGAIAGGIAGGFVLALLITTFFLLRRRQCMAARFPELAATPVGPQELQECWIRELHDPKTVPELPPSAPHELDGLPIE